MRGERYILRLLDQGGRKREKKRVKRFGITSIEIKIRKCATHQGVRISHQEIILFIVV